jgi:hypothetical protein
MSEFPSFIPESAEPQTALPSLARVMELGQQAAWPGTETQRTRVELAVEEAQNPPAVQLPAGYELPRAVVHLPQDEPSSYGRNYPVPERQQIPATVSNEERLARTLAHFGLDNTAPEDVDVLAAPLNLTVVDAPETQI